MLSLAMGLRQSLGLFMQPLTRDVHISISDFTLAIAVQNLAWGFLQPVAGALTPRFGFRPVMVVGALMYVAGLGALASAQGLVGVMIGGGVLIGASLACTASAIAMSVSAKAVSPQLRSMVFGIVSAAGSIGAMVAAPIGQFLSDGFGWRYGVLGFLVLACAMIPAAWIAGRTDKIPNPPALPGGVDDRSAGQAFMAALKNGPFMVVAVAFFVCGMQLVFLTTHLPSYLALCGMDPMLSAEALGMIGGFNVLGSLFFGWAGGRWNKLVLLGMIYVLRSLVLAGYFFWPPTPAGTLLFAGLMGFLWLGVAPLIAGAVVEMFGLRWQAMIQGIAFVGHQIGSFAGAFGGGLIYDALGSYDLAWRLAVATGLIAGAVQIASALVRPTRPPAVLAPA
jgi:predicted MFS family arabinose efflux permease